MAKPLAIDLFCGLPKTEFRLGADAIIQKFVAGRAKHPDHVTLCIGHQATRAIALKPRLVSEFKDAIFAATLAGDRQVWMLPAKSGNARVLVWSARIVDFLDMWLATMKCPTLLAESLTRAIAGAIPLIRVWWRDLEVMPASEAICARFGDVGLLAPPPPSRAPLATTRAIQLIGPNCLEFFAAFSAE